MNASRLACRLSAFTVTALAALGAAPALAAPELIEGSLTAPPGASAAAASTGNATVFMDETERARRGRFRVAAHGPVTGGSFRLTAVPSASLRQVAARGNGWVNLLLMVRTPAGKAVYPFTRRLTQSGWEARSDRAVRMSLVRYPPGSAPEPQALASQERSDCEWRRSRDYYRYTRVGQLHQWDGFRSTFHYATGSQADSFIGAAVAYGRGGFDARGERHITTSSTSEHGSIIRPNAGRFSRYVQTRFTYFYYYLHGDDCNRGRDDVTKILRAGRHVGGSYYKSYDDAARVLDGHCHTIKGQHRLLVAPRSTEWTQGGKAKYVGTAISILGVTLGSQSGWSNHVRTEWRNVGTVTRAICSVYGDPNTAPVTYVGGIVRE